MESHGRSIRLVAIDMDKTFLDDESKYDRARSARIHSHTQDDGIRFVVANGNQHRTPSRCFDHHPDVFYIAENGALATAGDEASYTTPLAPADLDVAFSLSVGLPGVSVFVCCAPIAYAPRTSDPDAITTLRRYYANLELVDDWDRVEEPVLELALECPDEETAGLPERLKTGLSVGAVPTSSGHRSIDITPAGVNKGVALVWLSERIGVSLDDMVAFGDDGNDVEMLGRVGTGVAMDNTPEAAKEVFDGTTGGNNSQGILVWLENHLGLAS